MAALSQTMEGLSQLILDLDPARASWARLAERAKEPAEELRRQLERLRAQLAARVAEDGEGSRAARLDAALTQASAALSELQEALSEKVDPARWRALYATLAASYEQMRRLVDALPQPVPAAPAPRISRTNLVRSLFHMGSGLFAALLYHFALTRGQAIVVMGALVVLFVGLEVARRRSSAFNDFLMRGALIKVIARPHEYFRVNSSTYFVIGLLIAAITCPKVAVELGCLVLAVADPVASTLGRRFGKTKLYRDKSFIGTAAFLGAALLASAAYLAILHPEAGRLWMVAGLAALVGALAELYTTRLDDNLTIPLSVALAASVLL